LRTKRVNQLAVPPVLLSKKKLLGEHDTVPVFHDGDEVHAGILELPAVVHLCWWIREFLNGLR
jgi:hypothetical protein